MQNGPTMPLTFPNSPLKATTRHPPTLSLRASFCAALSAGTSLHCVSSQMTSTFTPGRREGAMSRTAISIAACTAFPVLALPPPPLKGTRHPILKVLPLAAAFDALPLGEAGELEGAGTGEVAPAVFGALLLNAAGAGEVALAAEGLAAGEGVTAGVGEDLTAGVPAGLGEAAAVLGALAVCRSVLVPACV